MTLDSKFIYHKHIKCIKERAINQLKYLTRLLNHKDFTPYIELTIYKSYMHPITIYGAPLYL